MIEQVYGLKLLKQGVNGKIFAIVNNIYKYAKSCVTVKGKCSEFFTCNVGVRQGENLSPLLFAIYLNDFEEYLSRYYGGLSTLVNDIHGYLDDEEVETFVRLHCLLYADDTIVLAESPGELQVALDGVEHYCNTWQLTVNTSKTKIVIFSKGKVRKVPSFTFSGDVIDIVDDFIYLGIRFNYNGSFKKAISKQVIQARKALYSMLVKAKRLQLSVDTQCHLFDHLVLPILLYGSEVWGFECIKQIEIFHRKFLRTMLHVNKCTPDCMVYGETGRGLILNHVKCRMVGYWLRIVKGKQHKYSNIFYNLLGHMHNDNESPFTSLWLKCIKDIFQNAGLGNIWLAQGNGHSSQWILNVLKTRLSDMFQQEWNSSTWSNRICTNYRMFKNVLHIEKYFLVLSQKDIVTLSKFRCRSHTLPVNNSRYHASLYNEMICPLCLSSNLGDEFHYLFECPFFQKERHLYIPENISNIRSSGLKISKLFNSANTCQLKKIAKFARTIMLQFTQSPKKNNEDDEPNNKNNTEIIVRTRSGRIIKQPVRLVL